MKGMRTYDQARFTWVEILMVLTVIGLLTVIVLPNLMAARIDSRARTGNSDLAKIAAVTTRFHLENAPPAGVVLGHPADATPYLLFNTSGGIPGCPTGGICSGGITGTGLGYSLNGLTAGPKVLP